MNSRIPVKGEAIERDTASNALIFTDTQAIDRYEKRRAEILREKAEIDTLKTEVREIKEMLKQLLNKESN